MSIINPYRHPRPLCSTAAPIHDDLTDSAPSSNRVSPGSGVRDQLTLIESGA